MTSLGPTPLLETSGIVLAGGRSRRFGSDKLAEPMDGRPLIHHAVLTLASVCREVVVAVAPDREVPDLPAGLGGRLMVQPDAHVFGGPLAGLLTGLEIVSWETVLVIGGDMPWVRPALLRHMAGVLATTGPEAVVLREGDEPRALPLGVRRDRALHEALEVVLEDQRSLRALLSRLVVSELDESDWRRFDRNGHSVRDVDRREDLPGPG